MEITEMKISVRELFEGFRDDGEDGVFAYGGRLSVRPPYQREFVYDEKKRRAVIDTVLRGLPLNVFYWAKAEDGGLEVLDGQQRTLSICAFLSGAFNVVYDGNPRSYGSLRTTLPEVADRILDYRLTVYVCEGTAEEKLKWFQTINIAGERLTDQELRNASYAGPWLADAKLKFSKTGCSAYAAGSAYLSGAPIRQDYLETALDWASKGHIEEYMAAHQHDRNANELWDYFSRVIGWVRRSFPTYRKEMKGLPWGRLYDEFGGGYKDPSELEATVERVMADDDVTRKKGAYEYALGGEERALSIRAFTDSQKRAAYERQGGVCPHCHAHFEYDEMEGDHIVPWSKGGHTTPDNLQMLCKKCNNEKSDD